eukprot:scaffold27882_cov122-Isochrysis_galbana.AAC.1
MSELGSRPRAVASRPSGHPSCRNNGKGNARRGAAHQRVALHCEQNDAPAVPTRRQCRAPVPAVSFDHHPPRRAGCLQHAGAVGVTDSHHERGRRHLVRSPIKGGAHITDDQISQAVGVVKAAEGG